MQLNLYRNINLHTMYFNSGFIFKFVFYFIYKQFINNLTHNINYQNIFL